VLVKPKRLDFKARSKDPRLEIDRMSLNGMGNAIVFAGPVLAGPETSSRKKDKGSAMMR